MRDKILGILIALALTVGVGIVMAGQSRAQGPGPGDALAPQDAVGAAFTYQGQLVTAAGPVTGTCDFQFALYDALIDGLEIGSTQTATETAVTGGLFTVQLDFGAASFVGEARWLEIGVRCPAGSGSYDSLSPRQALTPAPYALYALTAPWSGLAGVPADLLDGDDVGSGWALTGNVSTTYGTDFIGTTDDVSLTVRVNDTVALRIAPGASGGTPNIIGGYSGNMISDTVRGAIIAGGGSSGYINRVTASYATVSGGRSNQATGEYAAIGGGSNITVTALAATVAGGSYNKASGNYATTSGGSWNAVTNTFATVSGGGYNEATGFASVIAGGGGRLYGGGQWYFYGNYATANWATVGGGMRNTANANGATIPGGHSNEANGYTSFAAGKRAKANNDGCFVWGDSSGSDVTCDVDDAFIVRASGGITMYTNSNLDSGMYLAAGGSAWNAVSDQARKENFAPVDTQLVLERLSEIPITTWNYKAQDPSILHVGSMAQDFNTLIEGLGGEGEQYVNSLDAHGVALVAIQGLHAQVDALEEENAALEARLDALEAAVLDDDAPVSRTGLLAQLWPALGLLALAGGVVWVKRQ